MFSSRRTSPDPRDAKHSVVDRLIGDYRCDYCHAISRQAAGKVRVLLPEEGSC